MQFSENYNRNSMQDIANSVKRLNRLIIGETVVDVRPGLPPGGEYEDWEAL